MTEKTMGVIVAGAVIALVLLGLSSTFHTIKKAEIGWQLDSQIKGHRLAEQIEAEKRLASCRQAYKAKKTETEEQIIAREIRESWHYCRMVASARQCKLYAARGETFWEAGVIEDCGPRLSGTCLQIKSSSGREWEVKIRE